MNRQHVIKRIKQFREPKMSAYELSLRLGKSTSYIYDVEKGKVNLSLDSLFAICDELDIEAKQLFE